MNVLDEIKNLHETDFSAWLEVQTQLIRERKFHLLDVTNLIEEMEDLGDSFKEAIESHLTIILLHRLKQMMQPDRETKSWNSSIVNAKVQISKKISRHPSLKGYPGKVFAECYEDARRYASKETGVDLRKFEKDCPWTLNEVLGD